MTNTFWQEELETLDRARLEALQAKKLRESIARAVQSPFYGKRYRELGLSADSIRTIADIVKLPFTVKDDLRAGYPYGMFAVPLCDTR